MITSFFLFSAYTPGLMPQPEASCSSEAVPPALLTSFPTGPFPVALSSVTITPSFPCLRSELPPRVSARDHLDLPPRRPPTSRSRSPIRHESFSAPAAGQLRYLAIHQALHEAPTKIDHIDHLHNAVFHYEQLIHPSEA